MILVIDGNNLANMCSYVAKKVAKPILSNDGLNVTTVDIFMKRIYSLYDKLYPDSIVVCWDKKLNSSVKNFRKQDASYKANRSGDNTELYVQCDIIENLLTYLGIKNLHPNVMEADDIIAWMAYEGRGDENMLIASFDKDLLQLIDYDVEYFNLRTKEKIHINNFEEVNGIRKTRFLLYKMVLGDRSDNIAGLKGYGKVKSKKLAESESPFEGLSQDQLKLLINNKKMMDLRIGYRVYPDEIIVYENQYNSPNTKDFDKFFSYASAYNVHYITNYKWKWEDLCLNN